jgi:hypothetical protein
VAIPLILADQKRIHDDEGQSTPLIFAAIGTAQAVPMARSRPGLALLPRMDMSRVPHIVHASNSRDALARAVVAAVRKQVPVNVECHHD